MWVGFPYHPEDIDSPLTPAYNWLLSTQTMLREAHYKKNTNNQLQMWIHYKQFTNYIYSFSFHLLWIKYSGEKLRSDLLLSGLFCIDSVSALRQAKGFDIRNLHCGGGGRGAEGIKVEVFKELHMQNLAKFFLIINYKFVILLYCIVLHCFVLFV